MAQRYGDACTSDDIEIFKKSSRPVNTVRQTDKWMRVYNEWATIRNAEKNILELPPYQLDLLLQSFYAEVKKKKGGDYEPNSLASMQASIDRFLKENGYAHSILKGREFSSSRSVLEGKARLLREKGMGNRPNRAHSLTKDEELVLWKCGQLGSNSPQSLINTIWWLLTQHLGLRGREKHHGMQIEQLVFRTSDRGTEYVRLADGMISKTMQCGLRDKHRLEKPFMFENQQSVCPVTLLKFYISKRPLEMKSTGPLYLSPIDNPASDQTWFKITPMGVNPLSNIVKRMIENSPLAATTVKKLTNHSARKTVVKKLKAHKVPKSDIITITGHTTEAGLNDYDSGNEEHQEELSHKIDLPGPSHSAGKSSLTSSLAATNTNRNLPQQSRPWLNVVQPDDPRLLNPSFSFFPNNGPFEISAPTPMPYFFQPQQQYPQQPISSNPQPIQHFHLYTGANLNMSSSAQATPFQAPLSPPRKLKRYNRIVDSDSDTD